MKLNGENNVLTSTGLPTRAFPITTMPIPDLVNAWDTREDDEAKTAALMLEMAGVVLQALLAGTQNTIRLQDRTNVKSIIETQPTTLAQEHVPFSIPGEIPKIQACIITRGSLTHFDTAGIHHQSLAFIYHACLFGIDHAIPQAHLMLGKLYAQFPSVTEYKGSVSYYNYHKSDVDTTWIRRVTDGYDYVAARKHLKKALELFPDEQELYAQYAHHILAELMIDGKGGVSDVYQIIEHLTAAEAYYGLALIYQHGSAPVEKNQEKALEYIATMPPDQQEKRVKFYCRYRKYDKLLELTLSVENSVQIFTVYKSMISLPLPQKTETEALWEWITTAITKDLNQHTDHQGMVPLLIEILTSEKISIEFRTKILTLVSSNGPGEKKLTALIQGLKGIESPNTFVTGAIKQLSEIELTQKIIATGRYLSSREEKKGFFGAAKVKMDTEVEMGAVPNPRSTMQNFGEL